MVVKIAESFLCQLLSNVINNRLTRGIYPGDAKIAIGLPLDKDRMKNRIFNQLIDTKNIDR